MLIREVKKDNLTCRVYENRDAMGKAAAKDVAETIRRLLQTQNEINMVFAAAPSYRIPSRSLCRTASRQDRDAHPSA